MSSGPSNNGAEQQNANNLSEGAKAFKGVFFIQLKKEVNKKNAGPRMFVLEDARDKTLKESLEKYNRIKRRKNTERVVLKGYSDITDTGLKTLSKNLATTFSTVQHLDIRFETCPSMGRAGMESLSRGLGKALTNIKSLKLNFSKNSSVATADLKMISYALAKGLYGIQDFQLSFAECDSISDAGLLYLSIALSKKSTDLQRLKLKFNRCKLITDAGIAYLSNALSRRYTKLQQLRLSFEGCNKTSNVALQSLSKPLESKLPNLENIDIRFKWCELINDEGLTTLFQSIGKLVNLRKVRLQFECCSHSLFKLKALVKALRVQLPNIQQMKINSIPEQR